MTYSLAIGDRMYSSWSLRGWLLFGRFGIPVRTELLHMYTPDFSRSLAEFGLARTVPALRIEDDALALWDSLAIAETLAERHPGAGYWPTDPGARALARTLSAEMHSGFSALRDECTMNIRKTYTDFPVSEAVSADLQRLETIWAYARRIRTESGPWLFGAYSIADVFYAPVATRIATYGLPVGDEARAYVETHLNDTAFRQWRAMAFAADYVQDVYELDYTVGPWPGPKPLPAQPVEDKAAINECCPFSGDPIRTDSLAEIDGTVVGFCNQFCRDKSVADAAAWPQLMALLGR